MGTERRKINSPVAEISPASSSNKRTKLMLRDRLSELPDSLLICILSFLSIKEAMRACLLSKRWQYLWTRLSRLKFKEETSDFDEVHTFVRWVNRTLVICGGNHVEKFEVNFKYDEYYASDVNVWLEFAVRNKVKDVSLKLRADNTEEYLLPQMMYFNSSLTKLSMRGCVLDPRGTVKWGSLKTLCLKGVELCKNVIAKILSGCPMLYHLSLKSSWGIDLLEIDSQSLRELVIVDCRQFMYGKEERLQISAPYVDILNISLSPLGNKIRVKKISSVVEAHIDFCRFDDYQINEWMDCMKELFESTRYVKKLVLGPECIELLSVLVVKGWRLPTSRRGILAINARRRPESIPGIIGLLESSPYLESLVINGMNCPYEILFTHHPTASYLHKGDLSRELLLLKTVTITTFMKPYLAGEQMLKVVKLLLKKAKVLEKMVIKVEEIDGYFSAADHLKIAQQLLSYPRSSAKAVVQFY